MIRNFKHFRMITTFFLDASIIIIEDKVINFNYDILEHSVDCISAKLCSI